MARRRARGFSATGQSMFESTVESDRRSQLFRDLSRARDIPGGGFKLFSEDLGRAFLGQLAEWEKSQRQRVVFALTDAVIDFETWSKARLRLDARNAQLGPRVANTWRSVLYGRNSYNPTVLLFSAADHIVEGQGLGGVIRPDQSKWLVIPTKDAPRNAVRGRGARFQKRVTPEDVEAKVGRKLRFVPVDANTAVLVVDRVAFSRGKSRRVRSATVRELAGGKAQSIVMFVLKRQVRGRAVHGWVKIFNDMQQQFPAAVAAGVASRLGSRA